MTRIRRASRDDIPTLAATLAAAFEDYAWTRWTVPADDHLKRLEAIFALDLTEIGLVHNEVWTTDEGTAVAAWIPPETLQVGPVDWEQHGAVSVPLLGDRIELAEAAEKIIAGHRPEEPYWYLASTGVHPSHQRKGLGTAVMAPVLQRCDRDGMPCLTETSSPENVTFYGRLGFQVLHQLAMPNDGPTVSIMWRSPR